jgi:hypothetical protein
MWDTGCQICDTLSEIWYLVSGISYPVSRITHHVSIPN